MPRPDDPTSRGAAVAASGSETVGTAGPLRVLLHSPTADLDPLSGDTTYTETLLAYPPPGVEYTSYAQALSDGRLVRRGRRPRVATNLRAADLAILGVRTAESLLRRRWMFREETWFVSIDPTAFDLVHNHIFTLRQVGTRLPMMSSAGYPLSELYRFREGWPAARASRADALETMYARAVGSHRAGYWAPHPDLLSVYTDRYAEWLTGRGVPAERIAVVRQGLPDATVAEPPREDTIGFIGRDFARKGGLEAVAAFEQIRRQLPRARMLVITDERSLPASVRRTAGVEVVSGAPREDVLNLHLPRMSVLLAPTRSDCGVPYAVIESLRAGVPVILSTSPWLDERLSGPGAPRAGRVDDVARLALEILHDPARARSARDHAREQFESLLSLAAWHDDLRRAYASTVSLHECAAASPT